LVLVCAVLAGLIALLPSKSFAEGPNSASAAVIQGNQGVQDGWVIDDQGNVLFTNADATLMAQTGAGWVRINFRLGRFKDWTETATFGYSALSRYDQVVVNARANGLKVLGLLSNESWHGYPTDWRANNAELAKGTGDNRYLLDFAQQAAVVLVSHFAGRIDWWEVWNEPNVEPTYLYPSNFAWLLGHVYDKTKIAGVLTARFVSGGVSSLQDANGRLTGASTGADYLRDTYARGMDRAGWAIFKAKYGSYPLDGIGQHIYIDGFARTNGTRIGRALQLVRDAYLAPEGTNTLKRIFITEVGWGSNNVSEQVQASNLQTAYTRFKATPYVHTAFWFSLRDSQAAGLYFGLLRPNLTQKPSWKAYQSYAVY